MIEIKIDIPQAIKDMPLRINRGFQDGFNRVVAKITTAAMDAAPRKTGTLKRSIHAEINGIGGGFSGKIVQDSGVAKYGIFVHEGTGIYGPKGQPIVIVPVNKKALFWKGAAHPVKRVVVKGMKGRPFMREGLDKVKPEIKPTIEDSLMREVKG